jgi:hypothetical protein
MIQRVQSLFLVVAVVCLVAALFFPVWQKLDTKDQSGVILKTTHTEVYTPDNSMTKETFPAVVLGILAVAAIVITLVEIFQYRSRLTQMKLGAVNSLFLAAFLGLSVYFTFRMEKMIGVVGEGTYEFGMYLPAVALICNLLANRFIRKDEALVRSVDRIR